jgi:hypothetical protein
VHKWSIRQHLSPLNSEAFEFSFLFTFLLQLAGHPIINFVLGTVADSPVCLFLFLALDRIGRRFTLCLSQVTLGLACIGKPISTQKLELI